MKKSLLTVFVLLTLFSCNEKANDKNEISFVTLSVINAKNENHPLNLLLDLNSKCILIHDNKVKYTELPPNPEGNLNISSKDNYDVDSEVITLSSKEFEQLRLTLSEFKEEDFKSKTHTSYSGVALKLNFVYNDNSFKSLLLINNSTKQHIIFFKQLFTVLFDKSNQKKILNEYYNKEYLK